MSYKTYTTQALVCGSTYSNTSDRSYLIFTEDAGMVWATAKSVREERSKQRYALQDFSHIRVSLVKGKNGWRIGSVESLGNTFLKAESRARRGQVLYVFSQLRRYVHGEIALPRTFSDALFVLNSQPDENTWPVVQRLFSLRLLADLGYIPFRTAWQQLLQAETLDEASALYEGDMAHGIDRAIKEAGEASHL